jgi:hypothetical protein
VVSRKWPRDQGVLGLPCGDPARICDDDGVFRPLALSSLTGEGGLEREVLEWVEVHKLGDVPARAGGVAARVCGVDGVWRPRAPVGVRGMPGHEGEVHKLGDVPARAGGVAAQVRGVDDGAWCPWAVLGVRRMPGLEREVHKLGDVPLKLDGVAGQVGGVARVPGLRLGENESSVRSRAGWDVGGLAVGDALDDEDVLPVPGGLETGVRDVRSCDGDPHGREGAPAEGDRETDRQGVAVEGEQVRPEGPEGEHSQGGEMVLGGRRGRGSSTGGHGRKC